jgi:uncharacterized membrane protein YphA (DoxX/SURF4 family)
MTGIEYVSGMNRNQKRAIVYVAAIGLLGLPAYTLIGVLTIPLGVGMLMLMSSSPWILYLYPFLFAGTGNGYAQSYYLNHALGLLLTAAQWAAIAWLASRLLRDREPRSTFGVVLALLLAIGAVTAAILWMLDIRLVTSSAHM